MSGQTRPDITFDVFTHFKYSDDKDINYVNKIITDLKQEPVQITYQNLGNEYNLKLSIFADASHGNFSDGESQLGYLIMLIGDDGKCSLLNWQSKRIKRVVRNTLAAEILALSDAVDDGIYISEIVSKLLFNGTKSLPIEIYTDSKSLFDTIKSKKNILEKRLRIDIAMLREMFEQKLITNIRNISTKNQLANALTKKGASTKELLDLLQKGVINIWNELYMFSFRWIRCHDINWTANRMLFEFIAFNEQVIKFDHIIRVKADRCPIDTYELHYESITRI